MRRAVPLALAAPALMLAAAAILSPPAAGAELKSQLSGWLSLNEISPVTPRFGLRWQPSLSLVQTLGKGRSLDGELSLDVSAVGAAPGWSEPDFDGEFRPYRLWLRLSSQRLEVRLGLQKINFGSATVFRPLMWFDRIDARDPLQITDGVTGLLLRYYFKGNANIWFWGLYGNDKTKGWETQPTAANTPEFGGRFQAPLFAGEAGITAHWRRLEHGSAAFHPTESRLAVDGKWDLGMGLWAEAAFFCQDDPAAALPWRSSLALGVDYTFQIGNGIYLLAEQFFSQASATLFNGGENEISFSAFVARYPVSLLDSLGAVFYVNWRQKQSYNFVSWQRTYDRWQFHLMLFWNPRKALTSGESANNLFSGRGFQLLAVWNI